MTTFLANGETISSTFIRTLINEGRVEKTNEILGRSFSLSGVVEKGKMRGHTIGFPTANIYCSDRLLKPKMGVYASTITIDSITYKSITNIGNNPTFGDIEYISVETHILDYDTNIYGETVTVNFLKFIREEKKFDTVNDLITQIGSDVNHVRAM